MSPSIITFTLIDAILLFGIELLLLLFLSPKLNVKGIWATVLLTNFLKIGILSLILPTLTSFYNFSNLGVEEWYILLLVIGFVVSLGVFEKDLGLQREEVIFPLFILNFLSSNLWKLWNSSSNFSYYEQDPFGFTTTSVVQSEGILQFGLLFILIFLFMMRKKSPKTINPVTING
jgi:hypothetical protein